MQGVVAVNTVPIAVALVVGVAGFVALIPLLLADEARRRNPAVEARLRAVPAPTELAAPEAAPTPTALPRASRLRLVASISALLVWSVWSVRRPQDFGRHD